MPKNLKNKPEVIYEYIETLTLELTKRFGNDPTTKDILRHLVERGMVEKRRLRNYSVTSINIFLETIKLSSFIPMLIGLCV